MIRPKVEKEPEPEPVEESVPAPPRAPAARPTRIPPLAELARTPATSGLVLLAIVTTLVSWSHPLIDQLAMQSDVLHDAPWRPFTSSLLHVNVMHLWFNAYWMLALGTPIERENGSVRTLIGYVVVCAASSLAEQALFSGGVGLSGIGYGTFAYGWARARREPAWQKIVDPVTTRSFVIWFFFCIATTVSGFLPIANVAHGVGALAGGLFGLARTERWPWLALVLTLALAFVLDVEPVRDRVNFAGAPAIEAERRGLRAIDAGDPDRAAAELAHAAALSPTDARVRFNYGVALARAQDPAACATFREALTLDPGMPAAQQAVAGCAGR